MEAHAKNSRKEIDYDVVRRFGSTKDSDTKEKLSRTKFHHLGEEDINTDPQEIEYETTNKFNPSQKGAERKIGEEIEYDTINKFNPPQKQAERRVSENTNDKNENTEHKNQNTNEMEESDLNKTLKGKERKGKKAIEMNSELMESHLQKQDMTPMQETNSPVKVLAHMEANIKRNSF